MLVYFKRYFDIIIIFSFISYVCNIKTSSQTCALTIVNILNNNMCSYNKEELDIIYWYHYSW